MKTNVHLWWYVAEFFLEWEILQRCRENQNAYFMFSNFFHEDRAVYKMWERTAQPYRPRLTI